MLTSFAAMAVIAFGAYYGLKLYAGFESDDQFSSQDVRLD